MKISFVVKITPSGKAFSTRIDRGPDWTQAELDGLVSGLHGLPPEKCFAVGREYFRQVLLAARPRRILNLFGLLYVDPSTGGSAPTPEGFHTAEDIKADFPIGYLAETIHEWRKTLTIEKTGEEGVARPLVRTVINLLTNHADHYTENQLLRLLGEYLGFTRTNLAQGVHMAPTDNGPWVRLNTYGSISDRQVLVLIPAGTTGPIWLKLINEVGHEAVCSITVLPEDLSV